MPTWAWWIAGYLLLGCIIIGAAIGVKGKSSSEISMAKLLLILLLWPIFITIFSMAAIIKTGKKP